MNILLIDDHTLFREALILVLNQLDSQVVVYETASAKEAAQLLSRNTNIELVLLDIDLPDLDGLTALPELQNLAPMVPFVVLSGSESASHLKKALENNAIGYIPKSSTSHEMLKALKIILQGDSYIPPRLLEKLGSTPLSFTKNNNDLDNEETSLLTSRQIEVLELMAKGLPNKTIAKNLNIAESTVKLHVVAILRALGARNRTEAVVQASNLGILTGYHQNI